MIQFVLIIIIGVAIVATIVAGIIDLVKKENEHTH